MRTEYKFVTIVLVLVFSLPCPGFGQSAQLHATINVKANKSIHSISPLLYGQFIEHMFEGVKYGLAAELLRNRSFEEPANTIGLSRYWERYPDDRNDDYGLRFIWDLKSSYPEKPRDETTAHSLQVESGNGVVVRHGVFQSRISISAGTDYIAYIWIKTDQYDGRIGIALEEDKDGGTVYSESTITPVKGAWRKYEVRLTSKVSDPLARFVILFYGRGKLSLDQVSLLPVDAKEGVRDDVFNKVKDLRPAFLRWPGGNVAQDYHWQWAVGPRDQRTPWVNLSWKNEIEPADFGTLEFISFSNAVGAEPAITVNIEGRGATADEAAAWVEYCNGSTATKYGALRAAHGYPQPFNVKLWELGNEIWGDWVRGHSDAETYARNVGRYAAAMRKVDPTIKIIGVGDNNMDWNRTVVTKAGEHLDYLAIHHYYGRREMNANVQNLMARPLFYERFYKQVSELLRAASPTHDIKLAINEWGLDLPENEQYSMLSALYGARLMNIFERSSNVVAMSAVSDLVNGWPGGIIQSGRTGLFVSPLYLVNQLYSNSLGSDLLEIETRSPTFDSNREGTGIPYLDAVASRSQDGQRIFIKVVNTNLEQPLATTFSVDGVSVGPRVEVSTINSETLSDWNSFSTPVAIKVSRTTNAGGSKFLHTLPPHSVTVLTLAVK